VKRLVIAMSPLLLAVTISACGGESGDESAATSAATVSPSATASSSANSSAGGTSASDGVSEEQAREIATQTAGAGATVREVERDDEDGRPVWKVKVTVNGEERKISVDRSTGEVVKNEVDTDTDTDTDNDNDG
jgi:uncharacterized membrane protein YkoI